MKIIHCSDLHIYGRNPPARTDDLNELQFEKLKEIVSLSIENNAPIICTGDIVDSPSVSYSIYNQLVSVLSKAIHGFYFIYGQHDLFFHNIRDWKHTATGALENSLDNVFRLDRFKEHYPSFGFDCVHWGHDLPKKKNKFLATHKPVVTRVHYETIPWMKMESDKIFRLEKLPKYGLILCGDWHRRFSNVFHGTTLLNPGAITRRKYNIDSELSHPGVFLIDLNTKEYKLILLKTAPNFEDVFNERYKLTINTEINQELQNFINEIKDGKVDNSKFLSFLFTVLKEDGINENIKKYIKRKVKELFNKIPYQD